MRVDTSFSGQHRIAARYAPPGPSRRAPDGGATRILIIDDERNTAPPLPAGRDGEGQSVDALEIDHPELAESGTALETRPVVHEFQIATPLPVEADTDHTADASVVRDLIARVEELLDRTRRLPAGASTGWAGTIQFGSVLLEPATQTVLRGGQPVRVTHTEFRLLLALMRRRGAIASRLELLREVWGAGAAVSRRAVDTHIARLRRKLEDDPANPRHILTALAWGYRFRP